MMIRFVLFFSTVSALVCYLSYKILSSRLDLQGSALWVVRAGFFLGWVILVAAPTHYRMVHPNLDSTWSYLFQSANFIFLGWVGVYLITSVGIEIANGVFRVFDPEKRDFLTVGTSKGILAAITAAVGVGWAQAKAGPVIEDVTIPIKDLPKSFDGFVITQISDVHIGPLLHKDFTHSVVDQVLGTNPDMIAVTGDIVDGSVDQLREHVAPFARLKAEHGVFFITGNHEYYSGADEWIEHFAGLGFTPLQNTNRILQRESGKILVGGVNDIRADTVHPTHKHDPHAAAACSDPEVSVKILLAHQPQSIKLASEAGFHLQLSGHTHAGQFLPFSFIARWAHPYFKGLNRHEDKMWIYVNRGTGYWGPPNRLGNRSEITRITLRSV